MEQPNPPVSGGLSPQPQPQSQPLPQTTPSAPQLAQPQVVPSPRRQPPAPASHPTSLPPSSPATSNPHPQITSPRPSPQAFSRPAWHHPHFSPSSSSPAVPSLQPRASGPTGGMAIGVPAASHPSPSSPSPFPSSFAQQHARPPESLSPSQTRPTVPQGMLTGNASGAQVRPGTVPSSHIPRPAQSLPRPSTATSTQSGASQNFQSHGFMRSPSPLPNTSPLMNPPRNMQPVRQPWMASGPPGKPPLPASSMRPQAPSPLSVRSSLPSQQQHPPSQSHSTISTLSPHEHNTQQFQTSKPQSQPFQQVRVQPSAPQKPPNRLDVDESCNRIISKRTINDLVSQIDPLEKLDPDVEDILVDIAEEFFDSITSFGCSLAKHRKSEKLESKDILLHLERNWNITLPGFIGDEIKTYKKPVSSEIHKERLAVVKKSMMVSDSGSGKNATGQIGSSGKNNQGKASAASVFSPTK